MLSARLCDIASDFDFESVWVDSYQIQEHDAYLGASKGTEVIAKRWGLYLRGVLWGLLSALWVAAFGVVIMLFLSAMAH